jgi:hypothetical protein
MPPMNTAAMTVSRKPVLEEVLVLGHQQHRGERPEHTQEREQLAQLGVGASCLEFEPGD